MYHTGRENRSIEKLKNKENSIFNKSRVFARAVQLFTMGIAIIGCTNSGKIGILPF
jgi:hypothetical protein